MEKNKVFTFFRVVNYYETDKMKITHHSNYIRYMEEARIKFLESIGYSYDKLENLGVISPVVSVEVNYKSPSTFNDKLRVELFLSEYDGVKLTFTYKFINAETEKIVAEASSKHCFVGTNGLPIIIKRRFPDIDSTLKEYLR